MYTHVYLPREGRQNHEEKRVEILAAGVRFTFNMDDVLRRCPQIVMRGGRSCTLYRTPEHLASPPHFEGASIEARDSAHVTCRKLSYLMVIRFHNKPMLIIVAMRGLPVTLGRLPIPVDMRLARVHDLLT